MNHGKFTAYQPNDGIPGAIYLRTEKGEDWYELLKTLSPDTWKLAVNDEGVIVSVARDASYLVPVDLSVVEVDSLPDGFMAGEWVYRDGSITRLNGNAESPDDVAT